MNAADSVLVQTRHIGAPRERVFDAFTQADALRQWHCPRGMRVIECNADARIGGAWRIEMLSRDGTRFEVGGEYRELKRPARLAYTWQWQGPPMAGVQTLVEIELADCDGGTLLTLRHSGFPAAAARDAHTQGWQSTLNRLCDHTDARGSAATLTLFGDPADPGTRSVRIALAEKGVACSLQACAADSPEARALHPFGRIPVLRDGETVLWEVPAILRYIDEAFDAPDRTRLTPDGVLARARCEQWISLLGARLHRSAADEVATDLPMLLAALDQAHAGGDFLVGGALSFADVLLAPMLAEVAARSAGAAMLEAAPNVRRALAALRLRPAFIATEPPPQPPG